MFLFDQPRLIYAIQSFPYAMKCRGYVPRKITRDEAAGTFVDDGPGEMIVIETPEREEIKKPVAGPKSPKKPRAKKESTATSPSKQLPAKSPSKKPKASKPSHRDKSADEEQDFVETKHKAPAVAPEARLHSLRVPKKTRRDSDDDD
jgi:hypothetical protein